ncbi:hypothetical protein Zm00014a_040704 [Zea mays]|uniref:Uncharacterized protein n=1 Tax=Zea mays TaxID=4577 RepID=A0A3L6GCS2_MAIZE|nr:hypothetical protein Zm00014a_040704 [Zea mays]
MSTSGEVEPCSSAPPQPHSAPPQPAQRAAAAGGLARAAAGQGARQRRRPRPWTAPPVAAAARGARAPEPTPPPVASAAVDAAASPPLASAARGRRDLPAVVHSLRGRCPRPQRPAAALPEDAAVPEPEAVVESCHVSARTWPFARGRTRPHVSARTQLHTGRQPSLLWAIQQIALGQRPDFSAMTMPPPPPIPQFVPTPQFSWPTPAPQVPPGNLLTPGNEDSEDVVASFVDGLLNSGGASGSNQPHPFDQPPPFE